MKTFGTFVRIIGSLLGVIGGLFTISLFFGWDQTAWSQGIPFSVSSRVVINVQFLAVLLLLMWVWLLSRQKGNGSTAYNSQQTFEEVIIEEDLHRSIADFAYDVDKRIIEAHLQLLFDKTASTKASNYESSVQLALISIVSFLRLSPREGNVSASLLRLRADDNGFDVVSHAGLDRTRGSSPNRVTFCLDDSTAGDAIKSGDLVRIDDTIENTQYQWYSGKSRTLWCIPYASTKTAPEGGQPEHLFFDHVLCVSSTCAYDFTDEDLRPILMLFAKISLSTLTLYYPTPKRRPRTVKEKK